MIHSAKYFGPETASSTDDVLGVCSPHMKHVLAAGAPWGGGGSTQHSELHSRQQLKAFVMDVPDRHMLLICEGIQNL